MRALIQRVKDASVSIDGKVKSQIKEGILVFLGVGRESSHEMAAPLAKKICELRVFDNAEGKLDKNLLDIEGEILIVSQFTLYASIQKGRRPDFNQAAPPFDARMIYEHFIKEVQLLTTKVQTGAFGAMMEVKLTNDGPLTILIDSRDLMPKGES